MLAKISEQNTPEVSSPGRKKSSIPPVSPKNKTNHQSTQRKETLIKLGSKAMQSIKQSNY